MQTTQYKPASEDALLLIDVQNDFLPGGNLAVPNGDQVIPVLNRYIQIFVRQKIPVIATRDWHPLNHCSFKDEGGIWPAHCIAETKGAAYADALMLPDNARIISKATRADKESYSGMDGTDLSQYLINSGITRVWLGGLATDYCVLHTVTDLLDAGFNVLLLQDAIRAVNVTAGDGDKAVRKMTMAGAVPLTLKDIR
ncbi:MAG: isochorismatase family protein [Calditrichales bacterium]|nr:MAG: isochorismatase family protein [Calditrichales bacterium]